MDRSPARTTRAAATALDAARLAHAFEAAVFDFDGTLVDTLGLHFQAYRDVLAPLGWELSREHFDRVTGGRAADTIPRMVDGALTPDEIAAIHRNKKVRIAELFATAPIPVLAPSLFVRLLAGSLPLALVTSGSPDGVRQLLARLGWGSAFRVIVSGDDVRRGKPDPEGFVLAAAQLGVAATRCVVFEDTTAGVAAAAAAGMTVIDVRHTLNVTVGYVHD